MIFPELIQHNATGEKIAASALRLLRDPGEQLSIKAKLKKVAGSLGPPGAAARAAEAILRLGV
jgi:lipid-A-disaccharide synthase